MLLHVAYKTSKNNDRGFLDPNDHLCIVGMRIADRAFHFPYFLHLQSKYPSFAHHSIGCIHITLPVVMSAPPPSLGKLSRANGLMLALSTICLRKPALAPQCAREDGS